MSEYTNKQTHAMAMNAIQTLAILCAANPDIIIDCLTGYLWSEEEGGRIKESDGKYDLMETYNEALNKLKGVVDNKT